MKISFALGLSAALVAPAIAHAAPGVPRVPPAIAQRAAQQNDVLFWYNRLPARHFAAFGAANREELLRQKGAIYNANAGYIEVPMPGDSDKNDVQKLQVKLYRANAGLVVAVSLVVWNQPRVPGDLTFYGVDGSGQLLDVTAQLFPYKLEKIEKNGKVVAYQSADLPRNGTTIYAGVPETDAPNDTYLWDKNRFTKRETPPKN